MASKDVEMKPLTLDTDVKEKESKENKDSPPAAKLTPTQEIKANIILIQRGVSSMEPRFSHRVLRTLTGMRKTLTAEVLSQAIEENLVKGMAVSLAIA
jgi:26S proteasome regulatory subunit N3